MLEVEVSITPNRTWIHNISSNHSAVVKILDCKPVKSSGAVQELFEILVGEECVADVLKVLKSDPNISRLEVISVKGGRIKGSLISHTCSACRILASSQCFMVSSTLNQDGTISWVMLGNKFAIRSLLDNLEKEGVKFDLKRIERAKKLDVLTKRQEEVLRLAFDLGYFDYPRRIDLRSLANILDLSPPTLSEMLRRAQKKVITEYLRSKAS
ncbi:MAG: helix-turn-helix domain-containing protein [Nitrososphaerales archaeon]